MLEIILEFVLIVITEFIFETLLVYPGAFIRWITFGGKKSYKDLLTSDDIGTNISVSLLFICLTGLAIYFYNSSTNFI